MLVMDRVRHAAILPSAMTARSGPKQCSQNIQKNRCRTAVAEPIGETLAELPFTGDQAVCLGHDQAAWSGPERQQGPIRNKLMGQEWFQAKEWFKIWAADIIVRDRVVHFWFSVDHSEEERRASRIVAENIAGVRRVEEHIVPSL